MGGIKKNCIIGAPHAIVNLFCQGVPMKSVATVSMPKAGSTVLDRYLDKILTVSGYKTRNVAGEAFKSPYPEDKYCVDSMSSIQNGFYYGCFRGPYAKDIPTLNDLKVVLQVRNPLDCLVSAYFSFTISHALPPDPMKRRKFEERAERMRAQGIDAYCLSSINDYINRFETIGSIVNSHPDIKVLFYEDMVLENMNWQDEIFNFLGVDCVSLGDFQGQIGDMFVVPKKENPGSHKRRVLPGDHLEKLNPETIELCKSLIRKKISAKSLIGKYL